MNAESRRLEHSRDPNTLCKTWGPYLSERQWGTVREDNSADGNACASAGARNPGPDRRE